MNEKDSRLKDYKLTLKNSFTKNQAGEIYTCVVNHLTLQNSNTGLSATLEPLEVYCKYMSQYL